MNNSKMLPLLILASSLFIPIACTHSISIPTTPPLVPTATPTNTLTFTPTGSFTPTNTFSATPTYTNTFTPTGSFTPTPTNTVANLALSSGVTMLQPGTYHLGTVNITGSAMVSLGGPVTIFATSFNLGAGATITGLGYWSSNSDEPYQNNNQNFCIANGIPQAGIGPENGGSNNSGGGGVGQDYTSSGGGHGGAGGYGSNPACETVFPGAADDDPIHPTLMGSGGGSPSGLSGYSAPESWGGGLLWLIVYDPSTNHVTPAVINGTIDMDGYGGCGSCGLDFEGGAGGAGGSILIEASTITGSGLLSANGAAGNSSGGNFIRGDGGGGIISLIESLSSFSGTTSVLSTLPGNAGSVCSVSSAGGNGIVTYTAAPASGY